MNIPNPEHKEIFENVKFINGFVDIHPTATIKIGKNVVFNNVFLLVKESTVLEIGDNSSLYGRIIIEPYSKLLIGNNLQCTNSNLLIRSIEGKSIHIGNDCLFADPSIYNADYHGIYNKKTGDRINYPKDVFIGDRVWLGLRSIILKGVKINPDSIVGAGSLVLGGEYPPNSMIAGNPAKVLREDVCWDMRAIPNIEIVNIV